MQLPTDPEGKLVHGGQTTPIELDSQTLAIEIGNGRRGGEEGV